ncbi:MAG: YigZ family protein [Clostridia bacterium]|nr:YigZ family protein [Clostridia bacterium]
MLKTIADDATSEVIEKKSRFIANIFYVESLEEAEEKIKQIKKKYYDARHNCFAFNIYNENGNISRFSDDGEPSGTAGAPMLAILNAQNLSNVLVVVTRYFGGILLGTGGLVRAYSEATKQAIENASIIEKDYGIICNYTVLYEDLEKIKYYFKQENIKMVDFNYAENVEITVEITEEKYQKILENIENLNFKILNVEKTKKAFIILSNNVE